MLVQKYGVIILYILTSHHCCPRQTKPHLPALKAGDLRAWHGGIQVEVCLFEFDLLSKTTAVRVRTQWVA